MELLGIHHLTAVTANAPRNREFYTQSLGLRLVKKTVNQDDTSAYHLFYADGAGTPGTDMTFFEWPMGRERRGTHSITRTGFRVASEESLGWWKSRFEKEGVRHGDIASRNGRLTLDFEDFEGQRLSLVDDRGEGDAHPWSRSPVQPEHQIRGLGPITISVPDRQATDLVLTRVLGMRQIDDYAISADGAGRTYVYEMGKGGPAAELHVAVEADLPVAEQGAGGAHHVAFRIPDADYAEWTQRLQSIRLPSSGPVDRFYFRSLYFREPNGILFELATDGPGFATDEPAETMGERLSLPPFLEGRRQEIEQNLKPL